MGEEILCCTFLTEMGTLRKVGGSVGKCVNNDLPSFCWRKWQHRVLQINIYLLSFPWDTCLEMQTIKQGMESSWEKEGYLPKQILFSYRGRGLISKDMQSLSLGPETYAFPSIAADSEAMGFSIHGFKTYSWAPLYDLPDTNQNHILVAAGKLSKALALHPGLVTPLQAMQGT